MKILIEATGEVELMYDTLTQELIVRDYKRGVESMQPRHFSLKNILQVLERFDEELPS